MRAPGRTRVRLAKMLTDALCDAGYPVREIDPTSLMEATGWYRTSRSFQNEALRWEVHAERSDLPKLAFWVTSWTTMTDIVRSGGVKLTKDSGMHIWADVK